MMESGFRCLACIITNSITDMDIVNWTKLNLCSPDKQGVSEHSEWGGRAQSKKQNRGLESLPIVLHSSSFINSDRPISRHNLNLVIENKESNQSCFKNKKHVTSKLGNRCNFFFFSIHRMSKHLVAI